MLWRRESLLTNSTRDPGGTVNSLGLAIPVAEIVILYGLSDGPEGDSFSPHALNSTKTSAADRSRTARAIRAF
jgi:hypothetical protein